jgi:acyl-CoA dehydrogenase
MTWRAIQALDKADNGDKKEASLLRLLTPMIKKESAEAGVYIVRESMELMGGIGYIEDMVMPKIMRDVMVLPIWEGAGNIMILDMLRATTKSDGFQAMSDEINETALAGTDHGDTMLAELAELTVLRRKLELADKDTLEASAAPFFERLFGLYREVVLFQVLNDESAPWIKPALAYFHRKKTKPEFVKPLSVEDIKGMMGWEF